MNVKRFWILCVLFSCATVALLAQDVVNDSLPLANQGKKLFATHCSRCHGVHQEIVGPMLASVTRKRSHSWLMRFIRDSRVVIDSGDVYAQYLFESYNGVVMPSFRMLSDEDITSILQYIEAESFTRVDETPSYTLLNERGDLSAKRGQTLFRDQCSSCHYVHYESRYAPALGSVARRHPRSWLIPFIRNSQKVIQGGDVYAKQLFEGYHERVMVEMEFLKGEDVNDILDYITFVSGTSPASAGESAPRLDAIAPDATAPKAGYVPTRRFSRVLLIGGGCVVAVLFALVLVRFFRYLNKV